jgi:hypothetical protein
MKITRSQLRRLIEGSIETTKRGGRDYVIPTEEPLEDPSLDFTPQQTSNIETMALSDDPEFQAQADFIADVGGFEPTDRYGAETYSKQVRSKALGIDMLTDPEIDLAISRACDSWIYEAGDFLTNYDAVECCPNFQEYAKYFIEPDEKERLNAVEDIKVLTLEVLNEMIKDAKNPNFRVDPKLPPAEERIAKYEKAKPLFSTDHQNEAVSEHLILKLKSQLFPVYHDYKAFYEREQGYDLSNPDSVAAYEKSIATFKEGKMRLTRKQLTTLIESYIVDDKGNVVSADDAYDIGLDTAAAAIDKARAESLVRSSDPETVVQGLGIADALDAEYSDFERTAVDMSGEDRQPNRPMGKLDSIMKAKYGQGQAMGEVYSLVVKDNMGKEVLIPIIDDHSEEEKKRGEGIPEDTMFRILDLYREVKKQQFAINQIAPELDQWDYEMTLYELEQAEYTGRTFSPKAKKLYKALERFDRAESGLKYYYFDDLLSNHVHEVLSYPPYNYSYQNAQNFELLRIEPRHEELEAALEYASGLE